MKLDFLGHACVALFHPGGTLLIDPYESGQFAGRIAYEPVDVEPDWVVVSHPHSDHSATAAVGGDFEVVVDGLHGPFDIRRHRVFHDEYDGRRRGGPVDILEIRTSAGTVVHLSDVGESPADAITSELHGADVVLVPIGGFYTIGAAQAWEWIERLAPRVTIPIHYRTPACNLPIDDENVFAAWAPGCVRWKSCRIDVQTDLPRTLILPPRRVGRDTNPLGGGA